MLCDDQTVLVFLPESAGESSLAAQRDFTHILDAIIHDDSKAR